MADLQVRSEVLDGLGSWLSRVSERLSGACTALRSLDVAARGAPPLSDAAHHYANECHTPTPPIGQPPHDVVRELRRVGPEFAQCDTAIAAACRPVGDEH